MSAMRGIGISVPVTLGLALCALAAAAAEDPREALWAAAKSGDVARLRQALDAGADPDAPFRLGVNALHYAAMRGHTEAARLLLERGAQVDAKDEVNQYSALTHAAKGGFCELVELLVARGADVNQRDVLSGLTPLTFAAAQGATRCVQAISARPEVRLETLEEALGAARRSKRKEAVEILETRLKAPELVPSWPQFRGAGAAGVAYGRPVPLVWDLASGKGIAWRAEIPGLGHSSPVVWGDRVFVTTAVKEGVPDLWRLGTPSESLRAADPLTWRLYCLDRRTGAVLWQRDAHQGPPRAGRHPYNSFASATPATDGRHVVAVLGSEGLFAYTVEGEPAWKQDLGVLDQGPIYDPDYQWGSGSSPILHGGRVIVQVDRQQDSYLAAFSLADGRPQWKTPRDEPPSWGTPTVMRQADRELIVTNGTNRVRAYDPATGVEVWSFATGNSMITAATPVAGLDLVFVANGFRPLKPIYALRGTGRGEQALGPTESQNDFVAWSQKSGGPYYVTPLLYGELLYVLTENGTLAVHYARTGEQIYRQRVGEGDRFAASPVAVDGKVFLVSEDGDVSVLRAGLEHEQLAKGSLGESCMATPAIVDGMILFRCRSHLIAVAETPAGAP